MFESFVNSEEYQTYPEHNNYEHEFESFVNSEEYQTILHLHMYLIGLRALLIQKSIKRESGLV